MFISTFVYYFDETTHLSFGDDIECGTPGVLPTDKVFIIVVSFLQNISYLADLVCGQILEYRHTVKKYSFCHENKWPHL